MRKRKSDFYFTFPKSFLFMQPIARLPLLALALSWDGGTLAITQDAATPDPPVPAAAPVADPAGTEAGADAVKRVRDLGFRLSSKLPGGEPAPNEATSPDTGGKKPTPTTEAGMPAEGNLQLGRVKENVALPPEVAALAKEGALAVADQQWEKARDLYLEMVKMAPDNALAYANLGVAEHQLGNLFAAAGNLAKSTELNPHIARNWQTLGLIHYERRELALALSCLTRAIHEDPADAESRIILAAVVRDYGWPEAAVTELQRAVEIDPKRAAAHYNLAITYLEADPPRLELARRHYYAAIDLGTAPSPEIEAILKPNE